jgi:hypothetical protein
MLNFSGIRVLNVLEGKEEWPTLRGKFHTKANVVESRMSCWVDYRPKRPQKSLSGNQKKKNPGKR